MITKNPQLIARRKKIVGNKLRDLRIRQGLSDQQVADLLGVWKTAVSEWELGKYLPPISHVDNLAKLYRVNKKSLRIFICEFLILELKYKWGIIKNDTVPSREHDSVIRK